MALGLGLGLAAPVGLIACTADGDDDRDGALAETGAPAMVVVGRVLTVASDDTDPAGVRDGETGAVDDTDGDGEEARGVGVGTPGSLATRTVETDTPWLCRGTSKRVAPAPSTASSPAAPMITSVLVLPMGGNVVA